MVCSVHVTRLQAPGSSSFLTATPTLTTTTISCVKHIVLSATSSLHADDWKASKMCGRFANGLTIEQYKAAVEEQLNFNLDVDDELTQDASQDHNEKASQAGSSHRQHTYRSSFNVAPQTYSPVVRSCAVETSTRDDASSRAAARARMQAMKWGLVPKSAKVLPSGVDAYRTINARDDTALSGRSMWTPLLPAQRCVIFVQGFYEWQKTDGGRIAHFVGMADEGKGRQDLKGRSKRLMPLAGLWERASLHDPPQEIFTFTILTTSSNKQLEFLHDRMPVILPDKDAIAMWIGAGDQSGFSEQVARLIKPYSGELDCYKCPRDVGKVGNNSPQFIQPVSARKDGIMAAFGRQQKKQEVDSSMVSANTETNAPLPKAELGGKRKAEDDAESSKKPKTEGQAAPDESAGQGRQPSSRFSPDPYNPPVSPHRPHGGYSLEGVEVPGSESPSKKAQVRAGSKSIEKAFQDGAKAAAARPKPGPTSSSPGSAKPAASSTKASPNGKAGLSPGYKKGGADIRSFFGKS